MPKISDLPQTGPITGAEQLVVVQGGATKRMPLGAFLEDTVEAVTAEATDAKNQAQQAVADAGEVLADVEEVGAAQIAAVGNAGAAQLLTLESAVSAGALAVSLQMHNQAEMVTFKDRLAALARGATPAVALAARIRNSGWVLEVDVAEANAGGTFNAGLIELISYDKGFDRNAQAVIRTRVLRATRAIRRPHPNQAQGFQTIAGGIATWRLSLDRQMFARAKANTGGQLVNSGFDPILRLNAGWYSVGGNAAPVQDGMRVANNSTEAYPNIALRNFLPPYRLLGATGLFEVSGNSIHPAEGRTLAAARCDITGLTSGVTRSQIVAAMTASTAFPKRTNAVPVFAAQIDMTAFTQGEEVEERWRGYPFIGDTPIDSQGGSYLAGQFCNYRHTVNHAGTFGRVFAVVNPATGSDTTGTASTVSEAAALATPFLTERAALRAALALNVSTYGRNNQSGIEICFSDTTHTLTLRKTVSGTGTAENFDASEISKGGTWCIYRPVTGATNCRLQRDVGLATGRTVPRRTCLRGFAGIDLIGVTSGTPAFLDGGEVNGFAYGQEIWIDNSPFVDAQGTASTAIGIWQGGMIFMTNCAQPALGMNAFGFGVVPNEYLLMRDTDIVALRAWPSVFAMGGVSTDVSTGASLIETSPAVASKPAHNNIVLVGVTIRSSNPNNFPVRYGGNGTLTAVGGLNILVEVYGATGQGTMNLAGDGANIAQRNFFFDYVTLVGGRLNVGYEDSFTMTDSGDPEEQLKKMMIFRRSALFEINTKTDLHQSVGARIHTWNVAHRVGWEFVRVLQAASDGSTAPGSGAWMGEAWPSSIAYIGPDARAQFTDWRANHRAPAVTGAGGGNYMPVAGSVLLGVIPANDEACPIDLVGNPRNGAVGALERAA